MVRSSANVTLGKCTILTFVGKTVGNSCPRANGLRQNTAVTTITATHTLRMSWRTPIVRTFTANETYILFTVPFLVSAKITASPRQEHAQCVLLLKLRLPGAIT